MKKIIYVLAAVAMLLQACSTNKSFSKKHYGHLKWIDHNTKVEVPGKETSAAPDQLPAHKNQVTTPVPVIDQKEEDIVPAVEPEKTSPEVKPFVSPQPKSETKRSAVEEKKESENEVVKNVNQNKIVPATIKEEKSGSSKPMMDDTAKLIICVILALIISPLGMYIWDQQTDVWFVVDLIAWLFWAFFIFGYGFGLLGLLAIVIALLRIFELI